jgi:hypothetical protein
MDCFGSDDSQDTRQHWGVFFLVEKEGCFYCIWVLDKSLVQVLFFL